MNTVALLGLGAGLRERMMLGMLKSRNRLSHRSFSGLEFNNFVDHGRGRPMPDGRSLGTFQADNVVDARHVDAAATALALLTTHDLDRRGRRKRRREKGPIDGDLGKV